MSSSSSENNMLNNSRKYLINSTQPARAHRIAASRHPLQNAPLSALSHALVCGLRIGHFIFHTFSLARYSVVRVRYTLYSTRHIPHHILFPWKYNQQQQVFRDRINLIMTCVLQSRATGDIPKRLLHIHLYFIVISYRYSMLAL